MRGKAHGALAKLEPQHAALHLERALAQDLPEASEANFSDDLCTHAQKNGRNHWTCSNPKRQSTQPDVVVQSQALNRVFAFFTEQKYPYPMEQVRRLVKAYGELGELERKTGIELETPGETWSALVTVRQLVQKT